FSERGNDAYPLSEMQAAVLLPQLEQLDARNSRREESARRLISLLDKKVWGNPVLLDNQQHSFYKLAFRLPTSERAEPMRGAYAAAARAEGLALDSGFRGFARRGTARCVQVDDLSTSRLLASHTLLLHHPVLLADDSVVDRAAGTFNKIAAGLHEKA
ncbi:MAG: DegT/DnrJ/EryC1/StrS family aminotransferase, partial [Pirellulales bacterium]